MASEQPAAQSNPAAAEAPIPSAGLRALWMRAALFVAIVGVLGSLHLSLRDPDPLVACPLCLYQRAFLMSVVAILAFGLSMPRLPQPTLSTLAMAPTFGSLVVVSFQVWAMLKGTIECPAGETVLPAPIESLLVHVVLIGLLIADLWHEKHYLAFGAVAIALGGVFGSTSIDSAPKLDVPTAPYEKPQPDRCRIPYKEQT